MPSPNPKRQAEVRRAAAGTPTFDTIAGVEAVTHMVVAADGTRPKGDEVYTGRRLTPLSLPRLKFMEKDVDDNRNGL
jgi:hypothetical protein